MVAKHDLSLAFQPGVSLKSVSRLSGNADAQASRVPPAGKQDLSGQGLCQATSLGYKLACSAYAPDDSVYRQGIRSVRADRMLPHLGYECSQLLKREQPQSQPDGYDNRQRLQHKEPLFPCKMQKNVHLVHLCPQTRISGIPTTFVRSHSFIVPWECIAKV